MRLLLVLLFLSACTPTPERQEGEIVIIGQDRFRIGIETHRVIFSERIRPVSVHDDINPKWRVHLENSRTFSANRPYQCGDTIRFTNYVRVK